MSVNTKIRRALEGLEIPISEDFFGGNLDEYITFSLVSDHTVVSADDIPVHDMASVAVHYFLPANKNYLKTKKTIRHLLRDAGFTWPEVTVLLEPDGKTRHVVFECEIENDEELED